MRSAAPTLTPEDIPLPPIIHTPSPLYIPPLPQPITQSKTTRPTSRSIRIIIIADWQTAFQWAVVAFQVRLNKYFSLMSEPHASLWKTEKMEKTPENKILRKTTSTQPLSYINCSRIEHKQTQSCTSETRWIKIWLENMIKQKKSLKNQ